MGKIKLYLLLQVKINFSWIKNVVGKIIKCVDGNIGEDFFDIRLEKNFLYSKEKNDKFDILE